MSKKCLSLHGRHSTFHAPQPALSTNQGDSDQSQGLLQSSLMATIAVTGTTNDTKSLERGGGSTAAVTGRNLPGRLNQAAGRLRVRAKPPGCLGDDDARLHC